MNYRNSKPFLIYALNADGELVHIDSVPNGKECACFCPHCHSELCAKNGGTGVKKVHHFSHINGADCVGATESALHKMAKDIMQETLCLQLPDRPDGSKGELLSLDRIDVELYDKDTGLRPDCIGYYGENVIWIEFKRTHAVDAKKKGKIITAKKDCVELDLNVCEQEPEAVRHFIMNEKKNRIWISEHGQNKRIAHNRDRFNYNNYYEPRDFEYEFAKDENGRLACVWDDEIDMNVHSYYCLVCGKDLTIDIDELGNLFFVHIDSDASCDYDLYLQKAAKDIIQNKFNTSDVFEILIPQNHNCIDKKECDFFQPNLCSINQSVPYNLKRYCYTECLKNYKLHDLKHKCDLVIKTSGSDENAIIINVRAGDCHIDVDTKDYRVINVEVSNNNELLCLLEKPIGYLNSKFANFTQSNERTDTHIEIKILKFTLYASGKYFIEEVSCRKINEKKHSAVLEYIFIHGIQKQKQNEARWYSLMKCNENNKKVCLCEICYFLLKKDNASSKTICKRYKTKGTPQYPFKEMPINCPFFKIDKDKEFMAKQCYNDEIVKEIIIQK